MELIMSIGSIGHIRGRNTMLMSLAVAALMGTATVAATPMAQVMERDMKRAFKSNLKVKKRNGVVREKVRTFTELPKKDINAFDILEVQNKFKGLKAVIANTLFDIFMVYKNEETTTEINDLSDFSNQQVAQFIHGAYSIVDADLQNIRDHFREDPKQVGNMNTLYTLRNEIRNTSNSLVSVLSAPEPSGNQIMSPEAITAVRAFENINRRINNLMAKIDNINTPKKG